MQIEIRLARMKLKSVLTILGVAGLVAGLNAQSTSVSSYSSYGIGTILFDNSLEQSGMGGLNLVPTNPYYSNANFVNPAANKSLNVTTFEFGTNTDMTQFKDAQGKSKKSTTYISNISMAFPVGSKARAGFGFQPYSSVGYEMARIVESEELTYGKRFDGEGGANTLHLMGSYNVSPEFSVGARVNYLFGDINRIQTIVTQDLALSTDYNSQMKMSGFQFTLGGMYTKDLGDRKKLDLSATYTLGANVRTKIEDLTTTYTYINFEASNIDTVQYSRMTTDMKLPQSFAIGASYRKDLKWMVGAQLEWSDWGQYKIDGKKSEFMDSRIRASVGGYWLPNFNSYKSYFDRVVYRFGTFYEQTPLKVHDENVKKYGLTVGMGMPIGKDRDASMLNWSLELGQMGTTSNGLVKENFANLKIGFTLNDVWFRKRVID